MGEMRGLPVAERAKSVALNEEGYSERQISNKLKFSKTAIYQAMVKFRNFGSFQYLHRSGRPKLTSQRDDHLIKWMVVRPVKQENWVDVVAQRCRHRCYKVEPIFLLKLVDERNTIQVIRWSSLREVSLGLPDLCKY